MRAYFRSFVFSAATIGAFGGLVGAQFAPEAAAQERPRWSWPETIENRQALPEGAGGDELRNRMISYAVGLGVRCQHCHVGEEGLDFSEFDFVSDEREPKSIARGMIRMTDAINQNLLPAISQLEGPVVTCFTCHRGSTTPATRPSPPEPAASSES